MNNKILKTTKRRRNKGEEKNYVKIELGREKGKSLVYFDRVRSAEDPTFNMHSND